MSDSPEALERLRRRVPVIGTLQSICAPTLTEIAILSGYDFIVLDCEHSVLDEPSQLASLQVISGTEAFSVVRVRPQDFAAVGRYLDFGAHAILLPDVRSAADASAFVAAATHGPRGTRSSTGAVRANRYGIPSSKQAPAPLLLAMIEGAQAVDAIEAIAATPGLDGLVIGPNDLAADLDVVDDFSAPAYVAAFTAVEQAAKRERLILGSRTHPGFPIERLLGAGHCFILAGRDVAAIREGYRLNLREARR